jgi:hypothetical protein
MSVDGGGSHTSTSYSVTINKPSASATVYKVIAFVGSVTGDPGSSALSVGGTTLSLPSTASGGAITRYGDVTSSLSTTMNAWSAGANSLTVVENGAATSWEGSGLMVIWNDSAAPNSSITILIGGETASSLGTTSLATTAINKSASGFSCKVGGSVLYSTGDGGQVSTVALNGTTITTTAGGLDDGTYGNGGLFTIGGDGDTTASEVYDCGSYVSTGDTAVSVGISGASDDY